MTGYGLEALAMLKEYGLAGVLAWLFWWTLRRMSASHDAMVRGLKEQLEAQAEATREMGGKFTDVVENHLGHVTDALARFDTALSHHTEDQRRWQDRLVHTLDQIAARLSPERSG